MLSTKDTKEHKGFWFNLRVGVRLPTRRLLGFGMGGSPFDAGDIFETMAVNFRVERDGRAG